MGKSETRSSSPRGWLVGAGHRWLILMGFASTVLGIIAFAASERRYWAWLAIAGLLVLVAAFGWTAHDEHKALVETRPDSIAARRDKARALLESAAQRLEHLATVDSAANPKWVFDQCVLRSNGTHELLDASLGPKIAEDYLSARDDHSKGLPLDMAAKAAYVRAVLDRLDSLPIMEDWHP